MTGSGPSSLYRPPCSACGFQSVWMTTFFGQTRDRSVEPTLYLSALPRPSDPAPEPEPQAAVRNNSAAAQSVAGRTA